MNLMRSLDDYEQLLAPARERFAVSPGVRAIESTSDDVFLELFLLHFCALWSQMTEPVERWIRRAAERCVTVGFPELARALKGHAQAEAGHHLMMIADVRSLAARWNACRKPSVDAGELLKEAPSPGVLHYRFTKRTLQATHPMPRSLSSMRLKCSLCGTVSCYLTVVSNCSELRYCLVSVS
jgi:hypothetical protein